MKSDRRTDTTIPQKTPPEAVGRSSVYLRVLTRVGRVSAAPVDVLLLGPSGSGKEHLALLVHTLSGRVGRWVPVNCAGLVGELADAELFGYVRGAFTGARDDRPGLLMDSSGGTLFLDELADLPLSTQAKLLRTLETRRVRAVGGTRELEVDLRVVAATCRDLEAMVRAGTFRDDLYQRLAGYVVRVPPLSERGADVVLIARHLLKRDPVCAPRRASLTRGAESALLAQPWPGNVRELRRVLRKIILDVAPAKVTAEHVRAALEAPEEPTPAPRSTPVAQVLAAFDGGQTLGVVELTRRLPLSRSSVQRVLRQLLTRGEIQRHGEGRGVCYRRATGDLEASLTPEQREVLERIARQGSVGRGEIADGLRVSTRTATRLLTSLVAAGLLEVVGENIQGRRYRARSREAGGVDGGAVAVAEARQSETMSVVLVTSQTERVPNTMVGGRCAKRGTTTATSEGALRGGRKQIDQASI